MNSIIIFKEHNVQMNGVENDQDIITIIPMSPSATIPSTSQTITTTLKISTPKPISTKSTAKPPALSTSSQASFHQDSYISPSPSTTRIPSTAKPSTSTMSSPMPSTSKPPTNTPSLSHSSPASQQFSYGPTTPRFTSPPQESPNSLQSVFSPQQFQAHSRQFQTFPHYPNSYQHHSNSPFRPIHPQQPPQFRPPLIRPLPTQPQYFQNQTSPFQPLPAKLIPRNPIPVHSLPIKRLPVHKTPAQTPPVHKTPSQTPPAQTPPVQKSPLQTSPVQQNPNPPPISSTCLKSSCDTCGASTEIELPLLNCPHCNSLNELQPDVGMGPKFDQLLYNYKKAQIT